MDVGVSLSHLHARNSGLDPLDLLDDVCDLGLGWVRLGVYWSEVEQLEGDYSFESLHDLLRLCEQLNLKVILTVGMKAPRWPEFYLPNWIKSESNKWTFAHFSHDDERLLAAVKLLIRESVRELGDYNCIKVWQIENEPLDASGKRQWRIGWDFLRSEVSTLRQRNLHAKILLTCWGNELNGRNVYSNLAELGDIVGIDLYPKIPNPLPVMKNVTPYIGPKDTDSKLLACANEIRSLGKRFWITELQMEPWEEGEETSGRSNPPSCMPSQISKNFEWVTQFEPEMVLLWGLEYWVWKREQGDDRWWKSVKALHL